MKINIIFAKLVWFIDQKSVCECVCVFKILGPIWPEAQLVRAWC